MSYLLEDAHPTIPDRITCRDISNKTPSDAKKKGVLMRLVFREGNTPFKKL